MKTKNVFTLTNESVTLEVFDAADKDKLVLLETAVFDLGDVPATLEDGDSPLKSLAAYGLSRIMQDRCSDFTDKTLGGMGLDAKGAAIERVGAYTAVYEVLKSGQYRARRASGGSKGATVDSFFAEGFARFLQANGKDVDANTATIILQGMGKDERASIRKHEQVAKHVQAVRAEATQAAGDIDLSALLG